MCFGAARRSSILGLFFHLVPHFSISLLVFYCFINVPKRLIEIQNSAIIERHNLRRIAHGSAYIITRLHVFMILLHLLMILSVNVLAYFSFYWMDDIVVMTALFNTYWQRFRLWLWSGVCRRRWFSFLFAILLNILFLFNINGKQS